MFEGCPVDHDVDDDLATGDVGPGGGPEHADERIETALCRGALHERPVHLLTVALHTVGPFLLPLVLGETIEDLPHLHSVGDTAHRVEIHALANEIETGPAVALGSLVAIVGAVGVGQPFPLTKQGDEVVVVQFAGLVDQDRFRPGEMLTDPRVDHHCRQRVHLGNTDLARPGRGRERGHQLERTTQPGEPRCLGPRPVACCLAPRTNRPMPIGHEASRAIHS
jgi:hypothetical protein